MSDLGPTFIYGVVLKLGEKLYPISSLTANIMLQLEQPLSDESLLTCHHEERSLYKILHTSSQKLISLFHRWVDAIQKLSLWDD